MPPLPLWPGTWHGAYAGYRFVKVHTGDPTGSDPTEDCSGVDLQGGFRLAFPGGRVEWEIKLDVNRKINPQSSDSDWVTYSAIESILSDIESAIEIGTLSIGGKPTGQYIAIGSFNTVSYDKLPTHNFRTEWGLENPVLTEDYDFVVTERSTDTMKIFLIGPIFIDYRHPLRASIHHPHLSRAGFNSSAESKKVLKYWGEPVGAFLQWNTGSDYPPLCSRESYSFAL